jgi:NhaP-type Na+/H+ and K+/H+ antiporter
MVLAVLCKVLLGWRFLNGLLLESIVGGSSSIIVIALSKKIGVSGKTETNLSVR